MEGVAIKDTDTQKMKETAKQIVTLINDENKNGLKQLFSSTALSCATDIDLQITQLFDYVEGTINLVYDDYSATIDGSYNHSEKQTKTVFKGIYTSDNGKQYYICFIGYYSNSENSDEDGLYMIKVVDMLYKDKLNVSIYSDIYPGIYTPSKEEIDSIDGMQ